MAFAPTPTVPLMNDDKQESNTERGEGAEFVDAVDLEAHPLTAARLTKLRSSVASGVEPYPVGFERTHTATEVRERHPDLAPGSSTEDLVTVAGRVMLRRSSASCCS